jgi:hypothetical protein
MSRRQRVSSMPLVDGRKLRRVVGPFLVLAVIVSARAQAADCDAVSVALGKASIAACPGVDRNGDGRIGVAELLGGGAGSPRAAGEVSIDVGTASGPPGASVTFDVTLATGGEAVAATENDIAFDPLTPVAADTFGDPDCSVNPGINKMVFTAFQPPSCTLGVDCTGIRVIVISFSNLDPIPDGPIYSCNVDIGSAAPAGTYPLVNSNAQSSDPDANALTTGGSDGAINVLTPLDHFKCYKVKDLKDPKFAQTTVALSDQFADDENADVKKPFLLCNPVSKNGEGISNALEHLTCYKIKTPQLASQPKVQVVNQFGTIKLQAKKAFVLCVPSSKEVIP